MRRHGDDDRVGIEVVERLDPLLEPHALAEHAPGCVAVHPAERLQRQDEIGVAARAEERRAHGEEPGRGVDLVRAEIERRPDEDVPEAVDGRVARAEPPQHRAERLAGSRLRTAATRGDDGDAEPVAQRHVRVGEEAGQARLDVGARAVLGEHRQREPRAQIRTALADAVEEAEVLGEAAERDVLPVVGRRLGIAVALRQRLHGAAERRARLVHGHVDAGVDELERGGEAREPAADDRDLHRSSPRATTASFAGVDSRHDGVEDVEAVRLHPVELAAIETGERRHAERAAAVERVEQAQPLVEMHACALRLERHERLPLRRHAIERAHAEARELVLRQIHAAERRDPRRRRA